MYLAEQLSVGSVSPCTDVEGSTSFGVHVARKERNASSNVLRMVLVTLTLEEVDLVSTG